MFQQVNLLISHLEIPNVVIQITLIFLMFNKRPAFLLFLLTVISRCIRSSLLSAITVRIPKWLLRLTKTVAEGRFWVMLKNQYQITDTILSYKYYLNKCWYLSSLIINCFKKAYLFVDEFFKVIGVSGREK